ncbi:Protein kinase superfamily protein [Rhynchospora pubera]|uniref:Protein kinase superfamily protein n=1 Tax=Rhynchospora pubera TaxID=906938 RepID=A0AAV8CGW4_9POAL|nr:Protein kinase superfamily protein [Rhynchospora pubera]KAJ4815756.1 Protein kinase superfamily protein [Rhynchospora pubera]
MWRLKQFMPKEQAGLENRTIDISNIKIHVKELLAEGGFSSVYLAYDLVNPSKQYALKHVMIQDKESYDLVMKEVSVMKSLKGHPNVVSLVGHTVLDLGRSREAMLLMEFCEKSLVSVLETRGTNAYFEEKKIVLIFRDVCNAVFAMHCQSPPMAHRDLKVENVLLGADGAWKLCDFGSVSTNHKIFDRPEEMGIEEDNIRKHTTPAYRAPEMWDLYRKEIISEKVDIWALGCLLYRLCYLKSAFDGESKLQVLNGNYRIPDVPKYSPSIINLIKDMLASSPDARPDITQVWFRVNGMLPMELQKELPDASPNASSIDLHQSQPNFFRDEVPRKVQSVPPPRRSPPPPPVSKESENSNSGSLGAFWSTQHAKDSFFVDDKGPTFDKEREKPQLPNKRESSSSSGGDFEITFSPNGSEYGFDKPKPVKRQEDELQRELNRLRDELRVTNKEKEEIKMKYEKLCAICASQRKEIEELKRQATVSGNSSSTGPGPVLVQSSIDASPASSTKLNTPPREKIEGTLKELQQGLLSSPSPDPKPWDAFADESKPQQPASKAANPRSMRTVRSTSGNRIVATGTTSAASQSSDSPGGWSFDQAGFNAFPSTGKDKPNSSFNNFGIGETKKDEPYQPAGWTGF